MEFYRTFRNQPNEDSNKNKKNKNLKKNSFAQYPQANSSDPAKAAPNQNKTTDANSSKVSEKPKSKTDKKGLIKNLISLKKLVTQPKEETPDKRFGLMRKFLNKEESEETIKIDSYVPAIYCPNCHSTNLAKIIKNIQEEEKFLYKCNECDEEFSEGSNSPFDTNKIPLKTWMECWYMLGLTTSVDYIAAKLDLDVQLVQLMIRELQKIFKVQQPLSKFLSYDEWYGESSYFMEKIKQEIIQGHDQLLGKVAISQERDSAEERKLKERRKYGHKPKT